VVLTVVLVSVIACLQMTRTIHVFMLCFFAVTPALR
jgi:hypothetical protein